MLRKNYAQIAVTLILLVALIFTYSASCLSAEETRDDNFTKRIDDLLEDLDEKRVPIYENPDYPIKKVEQKDPEILNILVIGIDARSNKEIACRADTILVATIDHRNPSVRLTSILRDVDAPIQDHGSQKINGSYAYGGIGLMINTVNEMFDLDIQHYLMLDFYTAKTIIDVLDGVKVDLFPVEAEIVGVTDGKDNPDNPEMKTYALNGDQALKYSRIRKIDSDFQRTGRQRKLIKAAAEKFLSFSRKEQVLMMNKMIRHVETDLSVKQIGNLYHKNMKPSEIKQYTVPKDGLYSTNSQNWKISVDLDRQIPDLHQFIWPEEAKVVE